MGILITVSVIAGVIIGILAKKEPKGSYFIKISTNNRTMSNWVSYHNVTAQEAIKKAKIHLTTKSYDEKETWFIESITKI